MSYPNNIKYRYRFEVEGESFFMGVNESKISKSGVKVKVCKYQKGELMNRLWISFDGGNWVDLEYGQRIPSGKFRKDFERYRIQPDGSEIFEEMDFLKLKEGSFKSSFKKQTQ